MLLIFDLILNRYENNINICTRLSDSKFFSSCSLNNKKIKPINPKKMKGDSSDYRPICDDRWVNYWKNKK